MDIKTLRNLLKTFTEKELYTTGINYGRTLRTINENHKDYNSIKEMLDLLQNEINFRKNRI